MAALFVPPKSPKRPKIFPTRDAEKEKAAINLERRRQAGTYSSTIVGSGLKTQLGA